jgi:hypothetical protein
MSTMMILVPASLVLFISFFSSLWYRIYNIYIYIMKASSKNKHSSQDMFSDAEIEIKFVVWYINTFLKLCTIFTIIFIHTLLSSEIATCVDC